MELTQKEIAVLQKQINQLRRFSEKEKHDSNSPYISEKVGELHKKLADEYSQDVITLQGILDKYIYKQEG